MPNPNHNINSDPLFVDAANHDYHILSTSPCKDPNGTADPPAGETDVDGEPRLIGDSVDMGADEYAFDAAGLRDFASAWLTSDTEYDVVSDGIVNFRDFAKLASYWTGRLDTREGGMGGMGNGGEQAPMWLECDNTSPDPNTDVTVYVHSEIPLSSMDLQIAVTDGNAVITGAMNAADCNQYGWESGFWSDPQIDPNGTWAEIFGLADYEGGANENETVGYFTLHYSEGPVTIWVTSNYSYDANGQPVECSSQPLIIGGQGMQQMMMGGTACGEAVAVDSSFNESQATSDEQQIDPNSLAQWAEDLWEIDPEVQQMFTETDWQAFIDSIRSSQ
jgi:hypothetical protein